MTIDEFDPKKDKINEKIKIIKEQLGKKIIIWELKKIDNTGTWTRQEEVIVKTIKDNFLVTKYNKKIPIGKIVKIRTFNT